MTAPTLDRDEVLRIARLAHLSLTDEEVDLFTRQLADILAYANQIQDAETSGVDRGGQAIPLDAAWRDDVVQPSLDRADVLREAPAASPDDGLFRVPKVL